MENMLMDAYHKKGKTLESFVKESKKIGDATFCVTLFGGDLSFLSLVTIPKFQIADKYTVLVFNKSTIEKELKEGAGHTQGMIQKKSLGEASTDFENSGLALMVEELNGGKNILYVSSFALPTLSTKAGVGSNTMCRKTLYRDMNLADLITLKNEKLKLVCRNAQTANGVNVNKVYGVFGTHHFIYNQGDIAQNLAEKISANNGQVKAWEITHAKSVIYVDFPELASGDYIPGLVFENSDIGICSYTLKKVVRAKGCDEFCVLEQTTLKHVFSVTIASINEKIDEVINTLPKVISPSKVFVKETLAGILPMKWVRPLKEQSGEVKDILPVLAEMKSRGLSPEIIEKARIILGKYL